MAEQDDATPLGNIQLAIQQAMMAARTVTVGKVLAYREIGPNQAPVVDVQIAPQLAGRPVDGGPSQTVDIQPKRNVPVATWVGGEFTVSTQLRTGQHVLLIVCDRELDSWMRGDGETYRPAIPGQVHDINDMVAFPFLTPESFQPAVRTSVRELFIGDRTGQICSIRMDSATGNITVKSATTIRVDAPAVTIGSASSAPTAPIARVGIDFVTVPPGGGTVPILPGPIVLPVPSAHKVQG